MYVFGSDQKPDPSPNDSSATQGKFLGERSRTAGGATRQKLDRSKIESQTPPRKFRLAGLPSNAEVFYDGFKVIENPFRVKQGRTLVQLQITAEGYLPYKVSIIPSRDLGLKVNKKPSTTADATTDAKGLNRNQHVPPVRLNPEPLVQNKRQPELRRKAARNKTRRSQDFARAGRGAVFVQEFGEPENDKDRRARDFSRTGRGAVIAEDFE